MQREFWSPIASKEGREGGETETARRRADFVPVDDARDVALLVAKDVLEVEIVVAENEGLLLVAGILLGLG